MSEIQTCIVAGCTNTSESSDKIFIPLPPLECKSLCDLTGVTDIENAGLYYCEDHYNLLYSCETFTDTSLPQDIFDTQMDVKPPETLESLLEPEQPENCSNNKPEVIDDPIQETIAAVASNNPQIEELFSTPEDEEIIIIQMEETDINPDGTGVPTFKLEVPLPNRGCAFATTEASTIFQQLEQNKVLRYECSQCNFKSLRPTVIHQHMMVHVEEDKAKLQSTSKVREYKNAFKCKLCDFSVAEKRELESHEKQVHYLNRRLMRCDFCSFTTMSESQYDNHICHDNIFGNSG
ncbi:uncharacterized protein LOC132708534 [Cylas formicarius]|uniref:uncharacterized protein LOC132708534 n=1 Tax=Cylas formicarius TaxID=197179 RepID=UPI002958347C|nr:uncharacterized protein LOC132708534 [Cylas formicarius]